MSLAKKIAHNTLIQIAGKLISTILGLLALALITRYLGLSGFGEYTTITTFLTFFAVVADLGLTLVTVQMISAPGNNEGKIINNLFGLRLVSAILILSLTPFIIAFLPYDQTIKIGVLVALASFLFPALNQVLIGLFQKNLCMDKDAIAEVVGRLVLIGGILISKKLASGLNGILIALVASTAINFILHYLFALKFTVVKLGFDWQIWKKIISKSWPLAITIVLNLIYLRADTLTLSLFRSADEVGLYGAAYKVIDILTSIPFMFAGLVLPIITSAWLENNHLYFKRALQRAFDFLAMAVIPIVIGAQFTAKPIMIFVAGQDFAAAGKILQVLIFAVAAIFLGTMFSHAVIALDKQKKMLGFYIFTSITSLIGYLTLIPRFSYFGAAAVTIYSEVLIASFSAYCVFKYSGWLPRPAKILKSLLASLAMSLLLYLLPETYKNTLGGLALEITGAAVIYCLALYMLGGIKKNDLAIIFKKKDKSNIQTYNIEPKL